MELKKNYCRVCQNKLSISFIDLGKNPVSNHYLKSIKDFGDEKKYPLHAKYCGSCGLVQLAEDIKPEILFRDYAYFSSYSSSWLKHSKNFAEDIIKDLKLTKNDFVVEIASNDGYLLKNFLPYHIKVLGVEPSSTVAKVAKNIGIETLEKFFNFNVAIDIANSYGKAKLVIANNVLAHTPDPLSMVKGLKELIKNDGVISIEFPHILNLIKDLQFDTVYHEHYSYYSLHSMENLLKLADLKVIDVIKIPTHGGSLRVLASHINSNFLQKDRLTKIRDEEKKEGILNDNIYLNFKEKVSKIKNNFISKIIEIKSRGKKIAAYGAAAKGNTFLNFCEINNKQIDYVCDLNPHKQNKYLPGTKIPILSPSKLSELKPDYIVILPWNLKDEIIEDLSYTKKWGCKFIISIPSLEIC